MNSPFRLFIKGPVVFFFFFTSNVKTGIKISFRTFTLLPFTFTLSRILGLEEAESPTNSYHPFKAEEAVAQGDKRS